VGSKGLENGKMLKAFFIAVFSERRKLLLNQKEKGCRHPVARLDVLVISLVSSLVS
jgi:hypothetical protein